ncbi:MAG: hypothetical protein KDA36_13280, partial [Planctomycetaceae bacterium]|nr:hypothetical protein [Planctomycetaceae bacterium]
MRRSACLLTILGMTVQSAVGADSLVPGAEPATTPRTLQFFSAAKTSEEDSAAAPQKFQRNSVSVETAQDTTNPPSPPAGVAQLAGEGIDMTPGGTNRQLKPASSTDVVEENTGVVHASFDADGDVSESSLIQQVRGERFGAPPPFPGMEAAKTREASPSAPAPSLTDPISISSQPTSAVQQENPFAAAKVTAQEKAEPTQVATAAPNLDQPASVPAVKADAGPITPTLKVEWRKQSD